MGQRENWKTIKHLQLHLPRNCCSEQARPDPSPGWGSLLLSCQCPPERCHPKVPGVPPSPPARNRHSCAPRESQKHGKNQQGGSPWKRCRMWAELLGRDTGGSVALAMSPHQVPPLSLDSCDKSREQLHSPRSLAVFPLCFLQGCEDKSCHPFPRLKQTKCKGHKSLMDFRAGEEHRDTAGTKVLFPSIPSARMSPLPCLSQLSGAITNLWHSWQPRGALTQQPQLHSSLALLAAKAWKNKEKQKGGLGRAQFGKQGEGTDPPHIRAERGGQPAKRLGQYFRYLSAHKNIKHKISAHKNI